MASRRISKEARGLAVDMVGKVQRVWGESLFYQASLKGPAPDRLLYAPTDPRLADGARADEFARGRFSAGMESVDCEGELSRLFDAVSKPGPLYDFVHDFSWLGHFEARGQTGADQARRLVTLWLDRCGRWDPLAWTPRLTAERLVELCCHAPFLVKGADVLWRSRLYTSMARQTRHLARAASRAELGYDRIMIAAGLLLAALCLPGCEEEIERGVELLRREARLQIRPDGGHFSRNPSRQLALVVRLQMIARGLAALSRPTPGFLNHILGRAAVNAQFFRCGDGGLAVFNGGYEDDPRRLLAAAEAADRDGAPQGFAPHSGYQKLAAARALVIADVSAKVGGNVGTSADGGGFDSAGSLHFSSGRSRIVVNCGSGAHLSDDWRRALAQAAAHSAANIEGPGAASFQNGAVAHRRAEDLRGHLLEIERGAEEDLASGPRLVRRLFLNAAGDNLRGEDAAIGLNVAKGEGSRWRIRFHLHPDVRASEARDGKTILLSLGNREGWRFRTNCQDLRLEPSVYLGRGHLPQPTQQIVLSPLCLEDAEQDDMVVKWAFQRLDGGTFPPEERS